MLGAGLEHSGARGFGVGPFAPALRVGVLHRSELQRICGCEKVAR